MNEKTLIVYSTRTGINSDAAHIIAEVLEKDYSMDVTIADLKDGQPDITPYRNIIVGGGVDDTRVYDAAVDFMDKNFEGKNVALYFSCEDGKNPKVESTEENTKKVLAGNNSLKPIDVAAFGGCRISEGKPAMEKWLVNPDPDIVWIMRENLKKNRLARMDADWVKAWNSALAR